MDVVITGDCAALGVFCREEDAAWFEYTGHFPDHGGGVSYMRQHGLAKNAVERAFEATQGVPRALNRLGKLALEFAWLHEYPRVTYAAVDAVARDSAVRDHQNQLIE